jgi:hypothetical protein
VTERRWRFLENDPALSSPGWLPTADECPELADLRAAHERLLAANTEALRAAGDLRRKRDAELEAQREAHEQAFLGKSDDAAPELTVTEDEMAEAQTRAEAARDALQAFAYAAVATICEREPDVLASGAKASHEAEAKRAEARALLAEADRLEAAPKRMRLWLDRVTGRSHLGLFPFDEVVAPPPPEPLDLEAALGGVGFTEVMTNA